MNLTATVDVEMLIELDKILRITPEQWREIYHKPGDGSYCAARRILAARKGLGLSNDKDRSTISTNETSPTT